MYDHRSEIYYNNELITCAYNSYTLFESSSFLYDFNPIYNGKNPRNSQVFFFIDYADLIIYSSKIVDIYLVITL